MFSRLFGRGLRPRFLKRPIPKKMNALSFQSLAVRIRSLVASKRPMWFDVQAGRLEQIEFRSKAKFWPAETRNIILVLFEFGTTPAPDVLARHKIAFSGAGAYVYLNAPSPDGEILHAVTLPDADVKRIGICTWNYPDPVVFEDLTLIATGALVGSEYAVDDGFVANALPDFQERARPDMLALGMMLHDGECNAHCHAICQHWFWTMDDIARRAPDNPDYGRANGVFRLEDGMRVPVTVFNGTPAMLRIPDTHDTYLERIGDKARNMIRKAQRQGYAYRKVDPDDHLDDVLTIRTSNPERQGVPIPDYYKVRPTRMIEEPFRNGCGRHGEGFFGVFKDDKLVAYTTIFFYGGFGQVNHILGHAEHLQEGVMNLLVSEMVRETIEQRPWVKALNYLYPHSANANTGIGLFKRSIGFFPERILMTRDERDLSPYFSRSDDDARPKQAEPPSEKKMLRATTSKAVKAAASTHDLIHPPAVKNRAQALEVALASLAVQHPGQKLLTYTSAVAPKESDFADAGSHTIVFDGVAAADFQEFLSSGLKSFRKLVPKESILIVNFRRKVKDAGASQPTGWTRFLPWNTSSRPSRIDEELSEYYLKRFKSVDLSVEDIKTGFKGSDYVVAGLVDYEGAKQYKDFDSWLILRKIR